MNATRTFGEGTALRAVTLWGMLCACHTASVPEAGHAKAAAPDGSSAISPTAVRSAAGVASAAAVGARADAAPPVAQGGAADTLWPVYEGACPRSMVYAVGSTAVVPMAHVVWAIDASGPRAVYTRSGPDFNPTGGVNTAYFGQAGGIDEAHAWLEDRFPDRGGGTAGALLMSAKNWAPMALSKAQFGYGYTLENFIAQPDGSVWAFGIHGLYLVPGEPEHRFFAWSGNGEPLAINLPGADMALARRLPTGELVAAGRTGAGKPVLRRWSPSKKLDDLALNDAAATTEEPTLAIGFARAALLTSTKHPAFFLYRNDQLAAANLNTRVHDLGSWQITNDDELLVAERDTRLWVETNDGVVREESQPEPGAFAATSGAPFWVAKSGALYTRVNGAWQRLTLADGPWTAAAHPKARTEWVKMVAGTTWASTVRTDLGFGRGRAGEVRVLYSSNRPAASLRCGAPFPTEVIAPLSPMADAACSHLVVVVAGERETELKTAYPKLGAALKGNTILGDALTFVRFGPVKTPLVGILAPTTTVAAELVSKLARVAPHAPEVVCGASGEQRRLYFDVKTAAFSAQP